MRGTAPGEPGRVVESEGAAILAEMFCKPQLPRSSLCILDCSVSITRRGTLENAGRWLIDLLALVYGTEDRNGLAMAAGFVHGAVQARSAHEEYHSIELDTVTFSGFEDGAVRLPNFASARFVGAQARLSYSSVQ